MRCVFRHADGVAVCQNCGRVVRVKTTNIVAECRRKGGPGTELSAILSGWPFYIRAGDGCSCKRHADTMDEWGCDICEARLDVIVGWLRGESEKRGLPFIESVACALVRKAISRAKKRLA